MKLPDDPHTHVLAHLAGELVQQQVGRADGVVIAQQILVGGIASLGIALVCGVWAMIHWKGRVVRRPSFPWVYIEADSSVDAPSRSIDPA